MEKYRDAEYQSPLHELSLPPAPALPDDEYNDTFAGARDEYENRSYEPDSAWTAARTRRRERLRKVLVLQMAAVISVVVAISASFGSDPLGSNVLADGSAASSSPFPSVDAEEPDDGAADDPSAEAEDDFFPDLPNLDPDFAGDYAWAGMGSEEYLVLDSQYLHAGTYYTSHGVSFSSPDGASYDMATNTLTLENYHGGFIDANLMGNGFKIRLIGDNSLDYIKLWGAMYGGSVTFTGSGSIRLNESGNAPDGVGLYLECEDSPSCVMVDRQATVEVFGEYAIVIHRTTLEKAIYTLRPVTVTGGTYSDGEFVEYTVTITDDSGNVVTDDNGEPVTEIVTVKDIARQQGIDLYDYSVVGSDGKPAKHVVFAPEN